MCTIYDLRIEFGTDHSMGLSVTVATRQAIDAGMIADAELDWDRERAIRLMHGVQQRLEFVHGNEGIAALPRLLFCLYRGEHGRVSSPGWQALHGRRAPARPMLSRIGILFPATP